MCTDAIRGAGRPEATHWIEILVEQAAAEIGMPANEIRRRNFIPKEDFPAEVAVGVIYDSGDYHGTLDKLESKLDMEQFERERAELRERGIYRGIDVRYRGSEGRLEQDFLLAPGAAPAAIRGGSTDPGFVSDAKPWLDATQLWGQALVQVLDAMSARLGGDKAASDELNAAAKETWPAILSNHDFLRRSFAMYSLCLRIMSPVSSSSAQNLPLRCRSAWRAFHSMRAASTSIDAPLIPRSASPSCPL